MSSSRPKTSLPVTGNLATEIFFGPNLLAASGFRRLKCEGGLLQVPTCDPTSCLDSACYCRHRLQQLVRSLESLCRIFLKEFLKENYDRLAKRVQIRTDVYADS